MRLPGFTAEASLRRSGQAYRGSRVRSAVAPPAIVAAFRWHPPRIPAPRLPPIHLPDPRAALRKEAERLAWSTAAEVDHRQGHPGYCPRNEIRAALLALGVTLLLTPDPTGGSKFMSGVIGVIALTLPDEYCRQSGR